jgi:hypothetical protein
MAYGVNADEEYKTLAHPLSEAFLEAGHRWDFRFRHTTRTGAGCPRADGGTRDQR